MPIGNLVHFGRTLLGVYTNHLPDEKTFGDPKLLLLSVTKRQRYRLRFQVGKNMIMTSQF